ncbi:unannotated protein [freshwater metagenome]|uniref:Unannotated protein n=1 Tax=freshwater metagenome TaxID=449393 RepID=A0A6J7E3P9_9ZZZZ
MSVAAGRISSSLISTCAMFANTGAAAVPPKRSRDAGSGSSIETNTVKRGFSAGKNPTNDAKYARDPSSLT